MQRFILLSVLFARCSAQSVCDSPTNCADCMATNPSGAAPNCFWSQPPSSTTAPATSGAICVNQSTFNALASATNAGFLYCPPSSSGCEGLASPACFANNACDWVAPVINILTSSSNICTDGFCALAGNYLPPPNMISVQAYNRQSGRTAIICEAVTTITTTQGLSPAGIGIIVAAVIIVLLIVPLLVCTKFGQELLAKCGCSCCSRLPGIFSKRTNLVAGEPSRTPRRG